MAIHIQSRGFNLTRSLERYIHRRCESTIGGRRENVQNLWVRLSDINGPRGGADKCCRVYLSVPHMADIFVQDTQSNMCAAVDNALDKAGQSLHHRLSKYRAKQLRGRNRDSHLSPDVAGISA